MAEFIVGQVVKRNLKDVRNIDKWVGSLLRKKDVSPPNGERGHADRLPGDIEDLSRKVRVQLHDVDRCLFQHEEQACICWLSVAPPCLSPLV
jgi:hypothetical protein